MKKFLCVLLSLVMLLSFKIVKIVWTFGINAFVYSEKLAVFFGYKCM